MKKLIKLKTTGHYPCQWDDLIDQNMKVRVTIYTLQNVKKDSLLTLNKEGIYYDKKDKIYDIVIDFSELTKKIVKNLIEKLSKITGIKYQIGESKSFSYFNF